MKIKGGGATRYSDEAGGEWAVVLKDRSRTRCRTMGPSCVGALCSRRTDDVSLCGEAPAVNDKRRNHLSLFSSSTLPLLLLLLLLHQRTAERSHSLLTARPIPCVCVPVCVCCRARPPPADVFFSPCSSSLLNPVVTQSNPTEGVSEH